MKINYKDKKEQRKFGILIGAICVLIGTARWAIHGFIALPYIWWGIGAVLIICGIVVPIILLPVFFIWLKLAEALNWLMTRILLLIVFYLIITPIGLLFRLVKGDPLHRQWLPKDATYWEEVEVQPETKDEFLKQF